MAKVYLCQGKSGVKRRRDAGTTRAPSGLRQYLFYQMLTWQAY